MPGGHLATSVALGAVAYVATGSVPAAAGCFAGGFLIDVDHYLDYLIFEKQWRRPSPLSFLSYYFAYSPERLVLPLHSIELMTLIVGVLFFYGSPLLAGYWIGAAMHMAFDVVVNGEYALRRPVLFYFFSYRAWNNFRSSNLMDRIVVPAHAGKHPVTEFFQWRPSGGKEQDDSGNVEKSSARSA